MSARIRQWAGGVATAVASMAVFAVALGCFLAMMLLVISMEEGGENLSTYTVSLGSALVLLSQGVGFTQEPLTLTLMPLLLTGLLIGVVRAFAQRFATSASGYCAGLLAWLAMDLLARSLTQVGLLDEVWLVLVKGALVFSVGYLLAAVPASPATARLLGWLRASVGDRLRHAIRVGVTLGVALVGAYLCMGAVTVVVWTIRNHAAMGEVFEMLGMGTGSRIVTTFATLAWLPNLCIWAVSWLFGGGFAIGDLGSFSLWIGQSSALPAIPAFGLLPEPVEDEGLRVALMLIPLATGLLAALIALWVKRGLALRAGAPDEAPDIRRLIVDFAYPAGALCITGAVVSVGSSLVFLLSNGGLGQERLARIGVDVMDSTQAVSRPTAFGLLAAWMASLVVMSAIYGIRWAVRRTRESRRTAPDEPARPRTAASSAAHVPPAGQESAATTPATKEERDDEHEPTDTTGTGIRLP